MKIFLFLLIVALSSCKNENAFDDKIYTKIYEKNDYQGAIIDLRGALKTNSSDLDIRNYYYLGYCYHCLKNYELALKYYNIYFEKNKDGDSSYDDIAYLDRGDVKYSLGDYHGSINDLNNSIMLKPKDPNPYLLRAKSSFKLGMKGKACDDMEFYKSEGMELEQEFYRLYKECDCENLIDL